MNLRDKAESQRKDSGAGQSAPQQVRDHNHAQLMINDMNKNDCKEVVSTDPAVIEVLI